MEIFKSVGILVLGFAMLLAGAHWLLKGAGMLAVRLQMRELSIGLLILAAGTSVPEFMLALNYQASADIDADLFTGILGSNVFNLFWVLGFAGVIKPFPLNWRAVWRDLPFLILGSLVLFGMLNDQMLRGEGENVLQQTELLLLFLLFGIFCAYVLSDIFDSLSLADERIKPVQALKSLFFLPLGILVLSAGSWMFQVEAVRLAEDYMVNQRLLAYALLVPFSALPELAVAAFALIYRKPDFLVGTVLGSIAFNSFLILPLAVYPQSSVYPPTLNFDFNLFILGLLLLFFSMFTGNTKKLDRWEAFLLLVFFVAYAHFSILRS